jgi:hypothetical protein
MLPSAYRLGLVEKEGQECLELIKFYLIKMPFSVKKLDEKDA